MSDHIEPDQIQRLRLAARAGDGAAQLKLGLYFNQEPQHGEADEAVRWLTMAARGGSGDACYALAFVYIDQLIAEQDFKKARTWLEMGAGYDHGNCLYNLGVMYHQGSGVVPNIDRAYKLWLRAAQVGDHNGQYNLAVCYSKGMGVARDLRAALFWAQKATLGGDERGQPLANGILRELGEADTTTTPISSHQLQDIMRALAKAQLEDTAPPPAPAASPVAAPPKPEPSPQQDLEQQAAANDASAQLTLAMQLKDRQDFTGALKWLNQACEAGLAEAQYELGNYYAKIGAYCFIGRTGPAELHRAQTFYKLAARQKHTAARRMLDQVDALMLKDFQQTRQWSLAAQAGDSQAQFALGQRQLQGSFVPANYRAALDFLEQAARQNHAQSQYTLYHLYAQGSGGIAKDPARALTMLANAVAQGHGEAMFYFVRRYADGRIGVADVPGAAALFLKCQQLYPDYFAPDESKQSPQELLAAAKQGDLRSLYLLGMVFLEGDGVAQTPAKGADLLRRAALRSYAPAQIQLARCYAKGDGITQDMNAGKQWALAAAKQGHLEARAELMMFGFQQNEIDAILNPNQPQTLLNE